MTANKIQESNSHVGIGREPIRIFPIRRRVNGRRLRHNRRTDPSRLRINLLAVLYSVEEQLADLVRENRHASIVCFLLRGFNLFF